MTFSTTPVEPRMMTAEMFPQLLKEIDTFIFDADGVLWLGEDKIDGSPQLLDYLLRLVSFFHDWIRIRETLIRSRDINH